MAEKIVISPKIVPLGRKYGLLLILAASVGITLLRLYFLDHPILIGILWLFTIFIAGLYTRSTYALGLTLLASALEVWNTEGSARPFDWVGGLAYLITGILITEFTRRFRTILARSDDLHRKLAEQKAVLSVVMASVPIVALDRSGVIQRGSSAAAELFGASMGGLKGLDFRSLVPAFEIVNPAEPVEGYWKGQRLDGSSFPLNIQHSPIRGLGDMDYVALHLVDLTRSHAADAQARELHTQLNKVWRLNSLGEMAATLAHELNQPLSAAATYLHASQAEVDRLGPSGENASRTAGLAKEQLLRAGQIIRRMRDLLSLEVRNLDRERASSMVEDLSPVLTMMASARGVSILLDMEEVNDGVRADRIQFQQAIVNLVRNAVEATWSYPDARVTVAGRAVSDTAYAITVEDNGPGLPPEEVERMFQPMTTTKSGGMGLGLSVTRTIVERHGGRLTVGSGPSGGAIFSFNLIRELLDGES
ncbi:two-component system sensor histidine kinase NtrB [Brevundimonas vesicularis]|uniref:two-component system sensor histidine kinase NtrB n=1 Tax=Brevundimonas vesicularis TaxID=41276 RepID=UPI0038D50E62